MPRPSRKKNQPTQATFSDPHDILMNAPVGIFTSTPEGKFLSVNPAMARMYGYDFPEDMVESVTDIARQIYVNPADRFQLYHMLKGGESARNFESLQKRKDGSSFWTMETVRVIRNEDGSVRHVQGFVTDISGQVQTHKRQRKESPQTAEQPVQDERHDRDVNIELENIIDRTAVQQLMSDFCELTGIGGALLDLKGNVLASTGWEDICINFHRAHPETSRNCMESDNVLSHGVQPGHYKIYRCKNNMLDIVMPVMVEDRHVGNLYTGQFFFEDEPPDHQVFKGQALRYGFDEEHYLAALKKVPLLDRDTVTRALRFYVNLAEIISAMGYHNLILAKTLDEREQLLSSLRSSEEKYRVLFENTSEALFVVQDGRIVFFNPRTAVLSGYSENELLSRPFTEFVHPEDREMVMYRHTRRVRGEELPERYAARILHNDDRTLWVEIKGVLIQWNGKPATLNFLSDITERKRAEDALRESEEKHRRLFETMTQGVVYQNADGAIISANPAAERILGLSFDQMRGKSYMSPRWKMIKKDRTEASGSEHPAMIALRTGKTIGPVIRGVFHPDKDAHVWLSITAIPLFQPGETKPFQAYATFEDITELKRSEEEQEKLQAQLLQAQKMESVGVLAGGIAHDFNNLLHAMGGNLELLDRKIPEDHPGKKRIPTIQKSINRAAQLVRQMLQFSRKAEAKTQDMDLNQEIQHAAEMLERTIPKMISIELDLDKDVWTIHADPVQVEQVLLNLGGNAADAMPDGGRLIIETSNVEVDEDLANEHTGLKKGEYVLLMVSDTGCGMDEDTVDKVFDPFFTTKEVGKGTGLGLASAYGIVKTHEGYISCQSQPGKGTAFKIYWPAVNT